MRMQKVPLNLLPCSSNFSILRLIRMNRSNHRTPLQRLTMSGADVQAEHLVRESAVELQALNQL